MNNEVCIKCMGHLSQVKNHLEADAECSSLIEKLYRRIGALATGEVDLASAMYQGSEFLKTAKPEELVEMLAGVLSTVAVEKNKAARLSAESVELIDTHRTYIAELEERCQDLLDEYAKNGGDVAKYLPIDKP